MRFLGFFIIILFFSQNSLAQAIAINNSNQDSLNLLQSIELYVDSTGKASIGNIKQKTFKNLSDFQIPDILFEEYLYSFFLKQEIKNNTKDTLNLLATVGEFWRQEMWVFNQNKLQKNVKGFQEYQKNKRAYPYDHKYLPFQILPYQTLTLYFKISDLTGKEFSINPIIVSPQKEAQLRVQNLYDDRPAIFINISFYAIFCYIIVIALSLFYFSRKRYLIYFAFYVFFLLAFSVYGFSYSSYVSTLFDLFPIFKFDLRQNFYILGAQIFLLFFYQGFMEIKQKGTLFQKTLFKVLIYLYMFFLFLELLFSLVVKRYDWELYNTIIVQIFISLVGIMLLFFIFKWKNLTITLLFKLGSISLFVGVLYGFLSAYFGWVQRSSDLFVYYPNWPFIFFILIEIMLFSLAMAEQFFINFLEKNRLQKQYAMSELSLLRSQINPHFIFNTLNSIKSYILNKSPNEASIYLTEFSDLIRTILEKSREQIVNLKQELEITEQYLQLEQLRFNGQFEYLIDRELNINIDKQNVPAFILQPFVENTIKHAFNGLNKKGFIKISIYKENKILFISLEDNGIGRLESAKMKSGIKSHNSMGTSLIENRIKLLNEIYNWGLSFKLLDMQNPTGTKVILEIPDID